MSEAIASNSCVYVVDDDPVFRESLIDLLDAWQFRVVAFGTARAYMAAPKMDLPSCLVLDVGLPDITGLDLQRQLGGDVHPPIVFLTGHGDIPQAVQAMRAGAVEFLTKPFDEARLLDAIRSAIAQDCIARAKQSELNTLRERLSSLTPRERDVLPLIVSGLLNKQSASELRISEVTLQVHRGRIMKKMRARSLAELVRMALQLGIPAHKTDSE